MDILCDAEGGGQPSYWFTRGERAAKRLTDKGIYQQLEYLGRTATSRETEPAARFKAFAKDMRLLMSLHSAMLDFGEWACVVDPDRPDRYRVEISGIEGVPDGIFMAAAGLFSALGRMSGGAATSWFFDRAGPDLALIRMTSAI